MSVNTCPPTENLETAVIQAFQSMTAFSPTVPTSSVELSIGEAYQSAAAFVLDDSVPPEKRVEVATWVFDTMKRAGRDLLWQIEGRLAAEYGRSLDGWPPSH